MTSKSSLIGQESRLMKSRSLLKSPLIPFIGVKITFKEHDFFFLSKSS